MMLHEICRPPQSSKAQPELLKSIAKNWLEHVQHPLAASIYEIALKKIDGVSISTTEAMEHLRLVQQYPNQYNALAIVYFACDDSENQIEAKYDEIIRAWHQSA